VVSVKIFGVVAAVIGFAALLLWAISLGLEVESKIQYRWFPKEQPTAITISPSWNWLTQDDSGRAESEGFSERPTPSDHPPKRLVIDGDTFTFHYARRSELLRQYCTAQIVLKDKQIWLPEDENGRELRQSVLHELMHAALYRAGGQYKHPVLSDSGDGEPVVNPTSRILLDILRDNPKLIKWLTTRKQEISG
jgi:hypothetical protein